jgi:alpha-beta hydrolase superfamily lysophospholipase
MSGSLFSLIGFLLFTALLGWAVSVLLLAVGLTRPPRLTDAKAWRILKRLSPADLGLEFTSLTFSGSLAYTRRPPKLAAWYISAEAPSDATVVVVHGYADAKVGSLAYVPALRAAGLNCVVMDMRASGDSSADTGSAFTFGPAEGQDLLRVIEQVRELLPERTRRVYLFGVSLGASVCLLAAERQPAGVMGVMMESPHYRLETAMKAHAHLVGLPGGWVTLVSLALVQWRYGWAGSDPAGTLAKVGLPILALLPTRDPYLPAGEREALVAAVGKSHGLSRVHQVEAAHMHTPHGDGEAYGRAIREFVVATGGKVAG